MNAATFIRILLVSAALYGEAIAEESASPPLEAVRGVVKATQEAILNADISARVSATPVRIGEAFAAGDLLIEFDCDVQEAERDAARAVYKAAKARYDSNVEMQKNGAVGQFDVSLSRAERDEASARARAISAQLKRCEIRAPYPGRVAELAVNEHETPAPDQPLMKIVASDAMELHLIAPSNWLLWLAPETTFSFTIDETGNSHEARVVRIGAEVDAVSRTVPIVAQFTTLPDDVLPGMSGSARFDQRLY